MQSYEPLLPEEIYHIYSHGVGQEDIFRRESDYSLFLNSYREYVVPYIDTFAYCLLNNHFHLLIRVKKEKELLKINEVYQTKSPTNVSLRFSHLFNSYAQKTNYVNKRKGGLFMTPFRRKKVDSDTYFTSAIAYIHTNPQKHRLITDFSNYTYSSYKSHLSDKPTLLCRDEVLSWFGGRENYRFYHENYDINYDELGFDSE